MDLTSGISIIREYMHAVGLDRNIKVEMKADEGYEYSGLDDPQGAYVLDGGSVFLAPGLMDRRVLNVDVPVPWWYVYTYRTINNYPRAPDDVDTVPLGDSQSFTEAAKLAICEVLKHRWAAVDEAHYIEEIKEPM